MTTLVARLALNRTKGLAIAAGLALLVLLLVSALQVQAREALREEVRLVEDELAQAEVQAQQELQELDSQIANARQELESRGVSAPPPAGSAYPPGSQLTWILEQARRQGVFVQEISYLGTQAVSEPAGAESVSLRLGAGGTMDQLQSFVGHIPDRAPTARIASLLIEGGANEAVLGAEVTVTVQSGPGTMPVPAVAAGLAPTLGGAVARVRHQLDQAWLVEDWPEVLKILGQLALLTPSDGDLQGKFYAAHFNHGMRLERAGQAEGAVEQYALALAHDPAGGEAQARMQALSSGAGLAGRPGEESQARQLDPDFFEFLYVVQPGDTLFFIARSFGTREEAVLERNAISGIRAGQRLVIRPPQGTQVTTVGEGQTLLDVATTSGQEVGYLMAVNRLETLAPPAGLKLLLIPQQEVIVYRVQPGETIPDIAGRYGTTPDAIRSANRIQSLTPAPGTILYVPRA